MGTAACELAKATSGGPTSRNRWDGGRYWCSRAIRTIEHLHWVTVAPLTRTIRGVDSEVVLEPDADCVPERCAVTLDNIATVEQMLLVEKLTALSAQRMNEVWEALHSALGMLIELGVPGSRSRRGAGGRPARRPKVQSAGLPPFGDPVLLRAISARAARLRQDQGSRRRAATHSVGSAHP